MSGFLRRHPFVVKLLENLFAFGAGALISAYVNVVTTILASSSIHPAFWLVGAVVFFVVQLSISWFVSRPPAVSELRQRACDLLEVTTRALILPHTLEKFPIRAQCRLYDAKTDMLVPFCQWSNPICEDRNMPIVCSGPDRDVLVIVRAFKGKKILGEQLPDNHLDLLAGPHRGMIWEDLCCVLAAPICDPSDPLAAPIGVVAFDSSKPLDLVKFDSNGAKQFAERVAGSLYDIVKDL